MRLWRELRRRNVVRVATGYAALGWMLIEIAETVFPRLMLPGWSVTLVIVALSVGFPIVLVLSWAYEITPEGIQREAHADQATAQRPGAGRVADYIIIGLLTSALGYFVVDKFRLGERNGVGKLPRHSIAVMAFEDMSAEGDQGYLSDGIAEELLNLLAQIPELRVISRSSSFSFRDEDVRIAKIAETLGVAHVLEGSVRKAGDRVRITAQLIDARTDSNVWSQRYDRTLDDIFAIQDQIATRVVDELRVELLGAVPKVHPTDPEAYDLYLRARERARAGSTDAFAASNELYRQALAIDPDYAAAWAQLGLNSVNQAVFDRSTTDATFARARQAFERALALDPEHALAHSGLGIIATRRDNDLQEAARRMQQALEYGSDRVTGIAATLLFELDRLELATTLLESVKDRDPLSPVAHYNLAFVHYLSGRWAQSIASLEEALRLSPDLGAAHTLMGSALLLAGRTKEARNAFDRKPLGMLGERGLALVAHEQQEKERYLSRVRGFRQRWGEKAQSSVAMIHAHAGEADAAFEWLNRAIEGGEEGLGTILRDPLFGPVHDDPRWRLTLSRIGRAPEQLARISFDVSHPARERNP